MKERQTTICLNELDWQMIDELKPVIGEKTLIAVLRYAIRALHRNFFGEIVHKRARLDTNKEDRRMTELRIGRGGLFGRGGRKQKQGGLKKNATFFKNAFEKLAGR